MDNRDLTLENITFLTNIVIEVLLIGPINNRVSVHGMHVLNWVPHHVHTNVTKCCSCACVRMCVDMAAYASVCM